MKTWKLVSGILSIVMSLFVVFQSMIVGIDNSLNRSQEVSGSAGLIVAILMLVAGIVSIVTRKGEKGGSIAVCILFFLAALIGFPNAGTYEDLKIWSFWCLICAVLSLLSIFIKKKETAPSSTP